MGACTIPSGFSGLSEMAIYMGIWGHDLWWYLFMLIFMWINIYLLYCLLCWTKIEILDRLWLKFRSKMCEFDAMHMIGWHAKIFSNEAKYSQLAKFTSINVYTKSTPGSEQKNCHKQPIQNSCIPVLYSHTVPSHKYLPPYWPVNCMAITIIRYGVQP